MHFFRRYATTTSTNIIERLKARGMLSQVTSKNLARVTEERKITLYAGVDPSAVSLHVGNLAVLMTMLHFHLDGHTVIPLIGGATGQVGDPGGRSTERELLETETVQNNASSITNQVENFFKTATEHARIKDRSIGTSQPKILNNLSWHSQLSFLSFLRFPGKLLRVNVLLTRDSVQSRLGSNQGISFAEFTYQLLQAYDFWYLNRNHGVELQIGGSDQWGNIISGVELIRKANAVEGKSLNEPVEIKNGIADEVVDDVAYGLTIPLLTTSTGEKFGKSAGNAIWLDQRLTSTFDFYQFFIRVSDADAPMYLRCLTLLSVEEIDNLMREHMASPEKRLAQHALATEVTQMIHGDAALQVAQLASTVLYDTSSSLETALTSNPDSVGNLLEALRDNPRLKRVSSDQAIGQYMTKVASSLGLVASHGMANPLLSSLSVSESVHRIAKARTLLQGGGLYLNNHRITELDRKLNKSDFIGDKVAFLRAGKEMLVVELLPSENSGD
ncbi:tyrosyl-tRNA synthetase [Serendipita sp. 398]|nr:tyrosyl-tRNA synthetase [Serendipita sp. 398]